MTIILVLALAGGGVVTTAFPFNGRRRPQSWRPEGRRKRKRRAQGRPRSWAARRAAEEQARAEAAEKARLEAERLAAEEAARKRQKKEPEAVEPPRSRRKSPWSGGRPAPGDFQKPVLLVSLKANNAANRKLFTDAFHLALETGRYDLYADFLRSNLERDAVKVIKFGKFDASMYDQSPYLMRANELYQLISKVGADTIREQIQEGSPRYFYPWLFSDPSDPLRLFLRTMAREQTPGGEWGGILRKWAEFWMKTSAMPRSRYSALALACAMLDPRIASSPSRLRASSSTNISTTPLTLEQVFEYFMEMDEARELLTDISKLSPSELLFVVDVRLPRSEMDWARKKVRLTRKGWGGAYSMIRYRMDRAALGKDPYTNYTFQEILDEGGICMDQAYFAVNTAKCNGIPSAYVTGDGNRGPHAWVNLLTTDETWQSYGGYGYNTGIFPSAQPQVKALNPLFYRAWTRGERLPAGHLLDYLSLADLFEEMQKPDCVRVMLEAATQATPKPSGLGTPDRADEPSGKRHEAGGMGCAGDHDQGKFRSGRITWPWPPAWRMNTFSPCGRLHQQAQCGPGPEKAGKGDGRGAQRPDFRRHQTAGGSPDGKRGQGRGGCPVPEVHEGLCAPRGSI
ncbi:MAG: hypothetical protein ACLT8E_06205 [Akkermansia sp.]